MSKVKVQIKSIWGNVLYENEKDDYTLVQAIHDANLRGANLRGADFATFNPNLTFLFTKVGCGIAGYSEEEVKKLFKNMPENVWLPKGWES